MRWNVFTARSRDFWCFFDSFSHTLKCTRESWRKVMFAHIYFFVVNYYNLLVAHDETHKRLLRTMNEKILNFSWKWNLLKFDHVLRHQILFDFINNSLCIFSVWSWYAVFYIKFIKWRVLIGMWTSW
jgi:hypothetical protein